MLSAVIYLFNKRLIFTNSMQKVWTQARLEQSGLGLYCLRKILPKILTAADDKVDNISHERQWKYLNSKQVYRGGHFLFHIL